MPWSRKIKKSDILQNVFKYSSSWKPPFFQSVGVYNDILTRLVWNLTLIGLSSYVFARLRGKALRNWVSKLLCFSNVCIACASLLLQLSISLQCSHVFKILFNSHSLFLRDFTLFLPTLFDVCNFIKSFSFDSLLPTPCLCCVKRLWWHGSFWTGEKHRFASYQRLADACGKCFSVRVNYAETAWSWVVNDFLSTRAKEQT